MTASMMDAALGYIESGMAIFPCRVRDKRPATAHWREDATTDPEQIRRWWSENPEYNIGMPTGAVNGSVVIDVDVDNGKPGVESLARLEAEHGPLPDTPRSRTGSGGWQYFLAHPGRQITNGTNVGGYEAIDIRGDGGYVVAPPSIHPNGEPYAWERSGIEPAPSNGLFDALQPEHKPKPKGRMPAREAPRGYAEAALRNECNDVAGTQEGGRNDRLNKAAYNLGQLVGSGALSEVEVISELTVAGQASGLPDREVDTAIGSGLPAGMKQPREIPERLISVPPYDAPAPTDDDAPPPSGDDVAEWQEAAGLATAEAPPGDDDIPVVKINAQEHRVTDECIAALSRSDDLYQRGGKLVEVQQPENPPRIKGGTLQPGTPIICPVSVPTIRYRITRDMQLLKFNSSGKGKWVPAHPPEWLPQQVLKLGRWPGVRMLAGVVATPPVLPGGRVITTPGYDEESHLYYVAITDTEPLPPLSRDAARDAAGEILGYFCDFPFESDEHRAAFLAAFLTPFGRYAYEGPTPLFLIDANVRGAGKSLLAHAVAVAIMGKRAATMANTNDDDEMRKRIVALANTGTPVIMIDNVNGVLGTPSLDAAMTSTEVQDRRLGKNDEALTVPLNAVWYATGNNIQLAGDMPRRVCHVRLKSPDANPEERSGFKHPELLHTLMDRRPALLRAATTALASYLDAGSPGMNLRPWGSFEGWSDLVRNAIVWVGYDDPGDTRTQLAADSDADGQLLAVLLVALDGEDPTANGLTAAEIVERSSNNEALKQVVDEWGSNRGGKVSTRSLGRRLAAHRDRVMCFEDGRQRSLQRREDTKTKVWRWYAAAPPQD